MVTQKEEVMQARQSRLNWLIVLVLVGLMTLLSFPSTRYYNLSVLTVGEPSPVTYSANQRYRVLDRERTREKRNQARASVRPRFIKDRAKRRQIVEDLLSDLKELRTRQSEFDGVALPREDGEWDRLREISLLVLQFILDQGVIGDKQVFERFEHQSTAVVHTIHGDTTVDEQKETHREVSLSELRNRLIQIDEVEGRARQMLTNLYREFQYRELVARLIERQARATVFFDEKRFEEQMAAAVERIEPYYRTFDAGETLLRTGETVTQNDLRILKTINEKKIRFQVTGGLAGLGVVVLGLGFFYFYFRDFLPELLNSPNKLALLAALVVLLVAAAKGTELMRGSLPPAAEYGLPFAAPIMLVALLINAQVAFLLSLFVGLYLVSFFGFQWGLFVLFLAGGLAGILCIRHVKRRIMLIQSGFVVAGVQLVGVVLFHALQGETLLGAELGSRVLWAGINGALLVPFVIMGLLPFLEAAFGITTSFSLLELADLSHPQLRDLFQRAPGTFQHSIMLSHLCERAADNVGADALLSRVGAYYHDLGKAENPQYFIENQKQGENPHDDLKPTLSASILKAHVKKGSETAREAGLPREIVDFIEQHHGTTLMKSFYYEALRDEEEISREEFQYPGPLPQTRETGICMLADAAEAACRALDEPTPQAIRDQVNDVVRDKIAEGQLDECPLTFRDIETIIDTFTRVLTSAGHRRVSYPDMSETERLEEYRSRTVSAVTSE